MSLCHGRAGHRPSDIAKAALEITPKKNGNTVVIPRYSARTGLHVDEETLIAGTGCRDHGESLVDVGPGRPSVVDARTGQDAVIWQAPSMRRRVARRCDSLTKLDVRYKRRVRAGAIHPEKLPEPIRLCGWRETLGSGTVLPGAHGFRILGMAWRC